jgi:hypothetical protein
MRSSMAVLTGDPDAFFKVGVACVASETLWMSWDHHSWMAFFAFWYFTMPLMAFGTCPHFSMKCRGIGYVRVLIIMAWPAN